MFTLKVVKGIPIGGMPYAAQWRYVRQAAGGYPPPTPPPPYPIPPTASTPEVVVTTPGTGIPDKGTTGGEVISTTIAGVITTTAGYVPVITTTAGYVPTPPTQPPIPPVPGECKESVSVSSAIYDACII